MRLSSRAAVALTAFAMIGVPVVGTQTATASAPPAAAAAMVPCLDEASSAAPKWRRYADTTPVTERDLAALPDLETRAGFRALQETSRLAARVNVPTYVHVIKGTHRGERVPAGPKRVRRLLQLLNAGLAGRQSKLGTPARYRFVLRKINYTKRDGWHHAFFNGPRDQRMKRKLHRGNARTLNLYINGGGPRGYPVLGWSRFPWQYRSTPLLDGVSINVAAMPGGKARGYNRGDTLIHEVGHWFGLFHTFQGGCSDRGDLVADTPAEAEPSYRCETTRDTCPAPGLDPVRNFMDYSLDACMNLLTEGQAQRMDTAFERWRA